MKDKWNIRWSFAKLHTGIFGGQLANSLAQKMSNTKSLTETETSWWVTEPKPGDTGETVTGSLADNLQKEKP